MADLACTRASEYLKAISKPQLHHLGVLKSLSNIHDRASFGKINSSKPLTNFPKVLHRTFLARSQNTHLDSV